MKQVREINVLDHGLVRLVDSMGGDLSVVRAARVSYDAAWRAGDDPGSDARLIRYLIKNDHTSPFEAVQMTFEVKAPIFVLRQWHRHRVWSFNELSARYRELPEVYYVPESSKIGTQSGSNKQGREIRPDDHTWTDQERDAADNQHVMIKDACAASWRAYHDLIAGGAPREIARLVLPVAAYSHMFATVSLHNLFRFLALRLHPHAQYEIRVYAEALAELARIVAPVSVDEWQKHNQRGAA